MEKSKNEHPEIWTEPGLLLHFIFHMMNNNNKNNDIVPSGYTYIIPLIGLIIIYMYALSCRREEKAICLANQH